MKLVENHSQPEFSVAGFEMDTLVLLHTCPHPLDRSPEYPRTEVQVELGVAWPVADDDYCMNYRPENDADSKTMRSITLAYKAEGELNVTRIKFKS